MFKHIGLCTLQQIGLCLWLYMIEMNKVISDATNWTSFCVDLLYLIILAHRIFYRQQPQFRRTP